MGERYTIKAETLSSIADAVRSMRYEKGEMTLAQIEQRIRDTVLGFPVSAGNNIDPVTGKWERPDDWPDIDTLAEQIGEDESCVYLTYDLRKTPGYGWIGVYVQNATSNTPFWVERGHLESGEFVVDESYERISTSSTASTSTRYFRHDLEDEYGDVQLWRVRSDEHIVDFKFCTNASVVAQCFVNALQPCVQRSGRLPYDAAISSSVSAGNTAGAYATHWLERDALIPATKVKVTRLVGSWYLCYNLQSLDVSKWDTSLWEINSLARLWYSCVSLPELDVSNWDTRNWKVTNMGSTWYNCLSLRSLDLSDWDTSGWEVTTLETCWGYCESLTSLNVGGWDTSNWKIGRLRNAWAYCNALRFLDLSNWDTTNWVVSNMEGAWRNCFQLESLDGIFDWDTSNWVVETLFYAFQGLRRIELLDLSKWNTSNWVVTQLSSVFMSCISLRELDISTWDTSNWEVTTIQYCFASCRSLKKIDISRWDTSKWAVTDARYFVTTNDDYGLRELYTPEDLGFVDTATYATGAANLANLEVFTGWRIYQNHSYASANKLTHDSLVSILNRLPTVTAARTITLGQTNRLKLTEAEIAIATQKGWTVA